MCSGMYLDIRSGICLKSGPFGQMLTDVLCRICPGMKHGETRPRVSKQTVASLLLVVVVVVVVVMPLLRS